MEKIEEIDDTQIERDIWIAIIAAAIGLIDIGIMIGGMIG
jgi:hypothetical protein